VTRTLRPCGDTGLLVELDSLDDVLGLHAALAADPPDGVVDLVPAARTVLLRVRTGADLAGVAAEVRAREIAPSEGRAVSEITEIAVTYDGEDLDDVAAHTGLDRDGVVEAHTGRVWTVAFAGFTPGFGYLAPSDGDGRLHVPRRSSSRTRVPAGAVGLAGEFSGIYPRPSPGGGQLIGRTGHVLWDLDRDPPAVLVPGARVRFRAV
jgi:KipI family sensor histidine kinase inhibitor